MDRARGAVLVALAAAGAAAAADKSDQGSMNERATVSPKRSLRRRCSRYPLRVAASLIVIIGALSACETLQQRISDRESQLAAAGFVVRPANTPEREAMLKRLPENRVLMRVRGDRVHYVYADPLVCNCLWVGSQQAYQQFKRDLQQRQLADEQLLTAQTYSDSAWNWGLWGPWPPGFGWYGPGW
jgi:hypothetical protein